MRKIRGKFVVIEGIDYSGKGTQIPDLARFLMNDKSNRVLLTREPTDSPFGNAIRKILELKEPSKFSQTIFDLFILDRKEHVKNVISPNLESGTHVISDRYDCSTYAYQLASGIPFPKLVRAHRGILIPDLTMIINPSIKEMTKRAAGDDRKRDSFDKDLELQKKARQNYLDLPSKFPGRRFEIINGSRNPGLVFEDLKKALEGIF